MQLFYNPTISETDDLIKFDKDESRHITKVLRKRVGETLFITNGRGWLFNALLSVVEQKRCEATISSKHFSKPKDYRLHLAVAPTKMNDRYEWFLEKATEIGVDSITPIICKHSERKTIKADRFEKIIQSAVKQSLQVYIPKLKPLQSFQEFIMQHIEGDIFIAHCEETDRKTFKSLIEKGNDITVLIGPEGDFSSEEIKLAIAKGFKPVTLGETRLRTETAAVVACHSVTFVNQSL